MEQIYLSSINTSSNNKTVANENSEGDTKLDWKQQKEEQAKLRKKQNDLKKIEDEITKLETRNDEIDLLLTQEEIYTNVPKLLELNNEKKSIESRLLELLAEWEELAE
jgi:ATP-binding cassette subfamily F protein 3